MPKDLHSQLGLRILQNDRNGFIVATLHYSADPRKNTPEWRVEARRGLSKAKFEQEYEISYDAMMGEKVFQEISSRRGEIIIRTGPYLNNDWPKDLPMWAGFDFGTRNPSSFHVYTCVDGILYVIWELYEPCKNIIEFVARLKACPYWDQLRYIAHDPSIYSLRNFDKDGGATSIGQRLVELGVTKLLAGNTDEQAWLVQMQKHWCGEEITFKILECCPKMIEEFESATYVSMSERQLETSDYKEKIVDKRNHSLDDCKYFMNSNPSFKSRKIRLPNLAEKYGAWQSPFGATPRISEDKQWVFIR